jgi:NAD(P)-dependent dehydrogenase (short-subunit alcohol dehydrogenase family)
MAKRLKDRVVLVTGAARGIGEAVSRLFAREGARVVATDIDDVGGEAVVADLGTRAFYRRLDVRLWR